MASNSDNTNRRGRPRTTGKGELIGVRLQPDQLQRLDDWIEEDGGRFSRPEAIRKAARARLGRTVASQGVVPLPAAAQRAGLRPPVDEVAMAPPLAANPPSDTIEP